MLRFGVTHTQTLGVSALGFPTQTTLTHTRKLRLPPPFISLRFCFISQELFYKLICQATQKFIEPRETKLRQTEARKLSSLYTRKDYRDLNHSEVILYQGQLQQTSMRYRSFSFRMKVVLNWKQSNVVHRS